MLCDFCSKKEAAVHLTEIINDQSREVHLCEECAKEKGVGPSTFGLPDLLGGLMDFTIPARPAGKVKTTCPQCGMTYDDFRKSGRLGCGGCYEAFGKVLAPLLKRIHGSTSHIGKSPQVGPGKKIQPKLEGLRLKERLKKAVAEENFEEAAQLRDQIRAAEAKTVSKTVKKKPSRPKSK